jgi:hypothetical protein
LRPPKGLRARSASPSWIRATTSPSTSGRDARVWRASGGGRCAASVGSAVVAGDRLGTKSSFGGGTQPPRGRRVRPACSTRSRRCCPPPGRASARGKVASPRRYSAPAQTARLPVGSTSPAGACLSQSVQLGRQPELSAEATSDPPRAESSHLSTNALVIRTTCGTRSLRSGRPSASQRWAP